jgi:hypothetical protein
MVKLTTKDFPFQITEKTRFNRVFNIPCKLPNGMSGEVIVPGFLVENKANKLAWFIQGIITQSLVDIDIEGQEHLINNFYKLTDNGLILTDIAIHLENDKNRTYIGVVFEPEHGSGLLEMTISFCYKAKENSFTYIERSTIK